MLAIVRLFFILFCSALPAVSFAAESEQETALAIEQAVASCRGDRQCEVLVRKRETLAAEKRRQRNAADKALRESSPGKYYFTLLGRFATVLALLGGAAGLYVLVMHLLFGKRKRRPHNQNDPRK